MGTVTALLIRTDKTVEYPTYDPDQALKFIEGYVRAPVEGSTLWAPTIGGGLHALTMWWDEVGHLREDPQPPNRLATALRGCFKLNNLILVGNIVVTWEGPQGAKGIPTPVIKLMAALQRFYKP